MSPKDALANTAIPSLAEELFHRMRGSLRLFSLCTSDFAGAALTLGELARATGRAVVRWDSDDGWADLPDGALDAAVKALECAQSDPKIKANPANVLKALTRFPEPRRALFVVHNFHDFLQNSAVARQVLTNHFYENRLTGGLAQDDKVAIDRAVVFLSADGAKFHPEVASFLQPLEVPRPDEKRIREGIVQGFVGQLEAAGRPVDPELLDNLSKTCLGLTANDITNTVALSISRHGGLTPDALAEARREKAKALRRSKVLDPLDDSRMADPDDVCGMEALLDDIRLAASAYTDDALLHRVDPPRGIVLAGLPGCGKSMLASATATIFRRAVGREFPLVKVDVGAIFGKYLGESEAAWREVKEALEAQRHSGVVVFFDEAGRAFAGMGSGSADSDGGAVAQRVFGDMLSWTEEMAQQGARIYPVYTMNATGALPAEFFSRVDDFYFLGLPEPDVRALILRTHIGRRLKKRGLTLEALGWDDGAFDELARTADDFVGRELEQAVGRADRQAFMAGARPVVPDFEELMAILKAKEPHTIARTQGASLELIRKSCNHGRPVRYPKEPEADAAKPRRRGGARKLELN